MPNSRIFCGSNHAQMGSNTITVQNQGGGSKKAGLPYQIGREYMTNNHFNKRNGINNLSFMMKPYNVATGILNSTTGTNTGIVNTVQSGYRVLTGTKPIVGTSGMSHLSNGYMYGWATPINLPFNVKMYGLSFNSIAPSSFSIIEIGSSILNGDYRISLSDPWPLGAPHLFLSGYVNSSSRAVGYYLVGINYCRVSVSTFTLTGPDEDIPNDFENYEITFFKQMNPTDDIYIEIVFGQIRGGGDDDWGMNDGIIGGSYTNFRYYAQLAVNSSYVLKLNPDGTFNSITSGKYIDTTTYS